MPEIVEKEVKGASVLLSILSQVVYNFGSVNLARDSIYLFYGSG